MGLGAIIGGAGQVIGAAASNNQSKENDYLLGKQAHINREQALYNHNLAKDMWNYTSFEDQKRNLQNAGLNPALLYGMLVS